MLSLQIEHSLLRIEGNSETARRAGSEVKSLHTHCPQRVPPICSVGLSPCWATADAEISRSSLRLQRTNCRHGRFCLNILSKALNRSKYSFAHLSAARNFTVLVSAFEVHSTTFFTTNLNRKVICDMDSESGFRSVFDMNSTSPGSDHRGFTSEPVWPSGKAFGWYARKDLGSIAIRLSSLLKQLWFVDTVL